MLRVTRYRFQATLRQRRAGYLALVLLIGLVGGLALGAVAGARRTQSSFSTYAASTNPSNLEVFTAFGNPAFGSTKGYEPAIVAKVSRLRYVHSQGVIVGFNGNLDSNVLKGFHPFVAAAEKPPVIEGTLGVEYLTQDRVTLVSGHLADPNNPHEAVMNAQAAKELGVHVGSVVQVGFYSDAQELLPDVGDPSLKPFRAPTFKLVGIVVFSQNVVEDQIDALGSSEVLLSPALTRELASCCAYYSYSALQLVGGASHVGAVEAEVAHLLPQLSAATGSDRPTEFEATADRAIKPEAIALGVFGGLAGLALLFIAAQVIGRQLRLAADERATLRALGADPAMAAADGVIGIALAVTLGSLLAIMVAIALSPIAPLGPVRPVYPSLGVAFDWTVLGLGFVAMVVVLVAASVFLAWNRAPHRAAVRHRAAERPSAVAHAAAASGLPTPAVTGIRFALDPGSGTNAVPVRSAIVGAVLAMAVVIATVTFGASLNSLIARPPLYGWNWNYALLSGYAGDEDLPAHQTATLLAHDSELVAASGVYLGDGLQIGDQPKVAVLGVSPNAAVAPPLLSGHEVEAPNQIVLAASTMAALRGHLHGTVVVRNGTGPPKRLVIVGTATLPAIGGLEMGSGAVVDYRLIPPALRNAQQSTVPGPNAYFIRTRDGDDSPAALRSLQKISYTINATNDDQPSGGVVSVLRPAEILDSGSIELIPTVLGAALALGAVVALMLTLLASVRRRRRDLALLKTLGLSGRQLATVVAWQSSVAVAIGAVVGVPLGIVAGRVLWDLFAGEIHAVPAPSVPGLSIVVVVAAALILANVVAAIPGRIAARTPTALMLRAE
jgi:hypothetical protein